MKSLEARHTHEVRTDSKLRYYTLRCLDSRFWRGLIVALTVAYMAVGASLFLFDIGEVCINPRLIEMPTNSLRQRSAMPVHEIPIEKSWRRFFQPQQSLRRRGLGQTLEANEHWSGLQHWKDARPVGRREDADYVMMCAAPYSPDWLVVSKSLNIACLSISITFLVEHVVRMLCVSLKYFMDHPWMRFDVITVSACVAADLLVFFYLRPRLLEAWENGSENVRTLETSIVILRFVRLVLAVRIARALRSELNPGTEIARTIEVIDIIKEDMPNVNIKSVQVVKNHGTERRLYEERKNQMEEFRGIVTQKLLFFGPGQRSPQDILNNDHGLDGRFAEAGPCGYALYGAERASYVDSCFAYTDWKEDPSGHTKKLLVYQALVGEIQDLGHETCPRRTAPDLGYDSVCMGPMAPGLYAPDELGLEARDVASNVYALYESRSQALLTAVITYENPDSFEETDKLLETFKVRSWQQYNALVSESSSGQTPEQTAALKALRMAIELRDVTEYERASQKCEVVRVPEKEVLRIKNELKQESLDAGVSLAFILSEDFLALARQQTGKEDPTFIELSDPLFINGSARKGEGWLCPRDLRPNCSFIDVLPEQHRSRATHFMSWVWGYKISTVREGLERWAARNQLNPEKVFLFICFFCNNQWRILVEKTSQGTDNLEQVFQARLQKIGKLVAVMDSWKDALYIQRIWTIFEQYVATQLGIEVQFTLPIEPATTLLEQLEMGKDGIQYVIQAISHVDAESAKATMEADEHKVKGIIRKSAGGFLKVNSRVKSSITQWVASEFRANIDRLVQQVELQEEHRW